MIINTIFDKQRTGSKNRNLGKKNPCSNMLVIPTKGIVKLCSSKSLPINLNVIEISWVLGRLMQPSSTPQQLILPFLDTQEENKFYEPLFKRIGLVSCNEGLKARTSPHIQSRSNRKGKHISSTHCCRLLGTYLQIGTPRQDNKLYPNFVNNQLFFTEILTI